MINFLSILPTTLYLKGLEADSFWPVSMALNIRL